MRRPNNRQLSKDQHFKHLPVITRRGLTGATILNMNKVALYHSHPSVVLNVDKLKVRLFKKLATKRISKLKHNHMHH